MTEAENYLSKLSRLVLASWKREGLLDGIDTWTRIEVTDDGEVIVKAVPVEGIYLATNPAHKPSQEWVVSQFEIAFPATQGRVLGTAV